MGVDGASESNSSSLPTAEGDAPLADESRITVGEESEVGLESTCFEDGEVASRIVGSAEEAVKGVVFSKLMLRERRDDVH